MAIIDFLPKALHDQIFSRRFSELKPAELYAALQEKIGNQVSLQIVPSAVTQSREDIATWYRALSFALDPLKPRRNDLYRVYGVIGIDNHLSAIIQSRTLKVTGTRWKVTTSAGDDPEKALYLQAPWFNTLLNIIMDSIFMGHALIEFGPLVENEFSSVQVVNRRHVRPEKGEFVIKETDQSGIIYRGTSLMDWMLEVGGGIGLLHKAAPCALWKKGALAYWSEYDEKFGIPFRTFKTPGRDKNRINLLADIATNMGSAGWAILQNDETVEILQNSATDAYKCFDMLIERCNTEMSKLILGQTMTTDSGASKSQAQVHMEVMESIYAADLITVQYFLNYQLLPFMIKHGYPFNIEDQIVPDLSKTLSPAERIKIDEVLLKHYTIDPTFMGGKYDIPEDMISEKTADPANANFKVPSGSTAALKAMRVQFPELLIEACTECGGLDDKFEITAAVQDSINQALVNDAWKNSNTFSPDFYQFLVEQFSNALDTGFKGHFKGLSYDAPDYQMATLMEANLFRFAAAKDIATLTQLNRMAKSAADFNAFQKQAIDLLGQVNGSYLRTEYNFVVNASENAANYQRQMETIDVLPFLEYTTAGDDRVRDAHAALDGKVLRADDPALDSIYPPNGWNCRCHMVPMDEAPKNNNYLANGNDAINILRSSGVDDKGVSEWDRMVKGGFNINRGKSSTIFDNNQMYISGNFKQNFTVKDNGLKPYRELKADYDAFKAPEQTADKARAWHKQNVKDGYLVDYRNRPVAFSNIVLENQIKPEHIAEGFAGKQNIVPLTGELMTDPHEVYFFEANGQNFFRYIRFHNDTAINVLAVFSNDKPLQVVSFGSLPIKSIDSNRTGMLIYKNTKA